MRLKMVPPGLGVFSIMKENLPRWFKSKPYLHFDLPLPKDKERSALISYVTDPVKVAHHPFSPLVSRDEIRRRHVVREDGMRRKSNKHRQICYACHMDALIYSYYAHLLGKRYESRLAGEGLQDSVLAYRRIPVLTGMATAVGTPSSPQGASRSGRPRNKSNIQFARETFGEIGRMAEGGEDVAVMVFDIKGFFDNLDHRLLKEAWQDVSGVTSLPDDEYAVYRQVVGAKCVRLGKEFFRAVEGRRIYCLADGTLSRESELTRRPRRGDRVVAYCDKKDFRTHGLRRLVRPVGKNPACGIPQGIAVSAVLANIYMLPFDVALAKLLEQTGGFFRRYCDDLIVACPAKCAEEVKKFIEDEIKSRRLEVQESKTKEFRFRMEVGALNCLRLKEGEWREIPLEYLGFSFDGRRVLLKPGWVNEFYCKMHRMVKRKKLMAERATGARHGRLFVNQLIETFTVKGMRRYRMVKGSDGKGMVPMRVRNKGNAFTYVWRACGGDRKSPIYAQLRRSRHLLNLAIAHPESRFR